MDSNLLGEILVGAVAPFLIADIISRLVLFEQLRAKYPKYYEAIGSPDLRGGVTSYYSLWVAQQYGYKLALGGMPRNFPRNKRLVKLARLIIFINRVYMVLICVGIISILLFSALTKTL